MGRGRNDPLPTRAHHFRLQELFWEVTGGPAASVRSQLSQDTTG